MVNNFLNIYTTLITITISVLGCFYSIYHYNTVQQDFREGSDISKVGTQSEVQIPSDLLIGYLLTFLVVLLPYSQNFGLRWTPLPFNWFEYILIQGILPKKTNSLAPNPDQERSKKESHDLSCASSERSASPRVPCHGFACNRGLTLLYFLPFSTEICWGCTAIDFFSVNPSFLSVW